MIKTCKSCVHFDKEFRFINHGPTCASLGVDVREATGAGGKCGGERAWKYWTEKGPSFLQRLFEPAPFPYIAPEKKVPATPARPDWFWSTTTEDEPVSVKIVRLKPDQPLPAYQTPGAAGVDLRAMVDAPVTLNPGDRLAVGTGIAVHMGTPLLVGYVFPRSGMGTKGLTLANTVGVIDSDYTGEIKLTFVNTGVNPLTISPGDRVAQLVFTRVAQVRFDEVDSLDKTERGTGGHGSTGVK